MKTEEIAEGIYLIGGPNVTRPEDAAVYLVDFGDELVMIDSGAGNSSSQLDRNIEMLGLKPSKLTQIILTHCHIDHIGSATYFREKYKSEIVIHELDARALETGDSMKTAANWYGTTFPPTRVDRKLKGAHEILNFGQEDLHCLHTPGHTPGSISVYLDRAGQRILFGQDIHGPFNRAFDSDIAAWRKSMNVLLLLEADILCEGHFGIYQPKNKVRDYIERYLEEYD
ncbi:MAG: Metallo-beta-lactamase L1 precursor [Deltaproteobacteria bacterium ADurb.Bin151]|nr:MAG: Metallo-beta-lactamase L1 precursor [Deltaproteobacteria bacterium ADurb.Bin151]HNZ10143.1 MBL fold metallo-hydrolase [Smithellaceae bacterium]HOG80873.1 MBL fold metallo-hydrolase [Smithellaceae bacterium]HQP24094.1 MBL fold metallo-hydrolase [Smithellaceae bacterium]HRY35008.1 MBL fold metallo-hydrolase [Smithellaceae bacterium]